MLNLYAFAPFHAILAAENQGVSVFIIQFYALNRKLLKNFSTKFGQNLKKLKTVFSDWKLR
jgi:hypothetical protein